MKLSVSLPESDLAILDRFVQESDLPSRSAGVQEAIRRLEDTELIDAYSDAFDEWEQSGRARDWETVIADGLDAPR